MSKKTSNFAQSWPNNINSMQFMKAKAKGYIYITENVYFRNSLNSDFLPPSSYSFLYLMRHWVSIIGLTSWNEAWLVFYSTSLSIYTQQKHLNGGKWLPSMFHLSTSLTWLFFNGYSQNVSGESRLQCHSQCQHCEKCFEPQCLQFLQ